MFVDRIWFNGLGMFGGRMFPGAVLYKADAVYRGTANEICLTGDFSDDGDLAGD